MVWWKIENFHIVVQVGGLKTRLGKKKKKKKIELSFFLIQPIIKISIDFV